MILKFFWSLDNEVRTHDFDNSYLLRRKRQQGIRVRFPTTIQTPESKVGEEGSNAGLGVIGLLQRPN